MRPPGPPAPAKGARLGLQLGLREAMAHRGRLVRTAASVALAVSLVSGTFVLTDTIDGAFHQATRPQGVDVVVRTTSAFSAVANSVSERSPLPESLLDVVRAIPGVEAVWGQVSGYATLTRPDGQAVSGTGLPTVGTAWAPDATIVAGRAPTGPGEVVIDEDTARRDDLQIGDRIQILFGNLIEEYTVAGLRKLGGLLASTEATFDIETAQRVLGRLGWLDAISVTAAAGVDPEDLRVLIGDTLDPGYEVVTSDQAAQEATASWTDALGFLTTALLLFAGVALLVGAFIIANTFSILVAQRTRELGLLRALGAGRARIVRSVLIEALAVGLVASALGVVLGVATAHGLLRLMGALGFEVPAAAVILRPTAALAGLAAGVVVTLGAALAPALRSSRISPVAAMEAGDGSPGANDPAGAPDRGPSRGARMGLSLVAAGGGLVALGLSGRLSDPVPSTGAGAAALLVGFGLLTPLIARPAARVIGAPLVAVFGESARLGRENAMRHPRRTAATAGALMIGVSLVGVVAIVGQSMKASAARTISQSMRSDFVVTTEERVVGGGGLPTVVAETLARTDGVELVSAVRGGQFGLDGRTADLIAVDPATVGRMYELDPVSAAGARLLSNTSLLIRDSVAASHGWGVGDEVPLTFARTGEQIFRVAATFDTAAVRADYVISLGAHQANYLQQLDLQVDVRLAPGVSARDGRVNIEAALAGIPNVAVRDRAQVMAAQSVEVDRMLVPVTALLALALGIGLLGIANTLSLSMHDRRREMGLLRSVGMAKSQLRAMVRSEALVVAVLGGLLGVTTAVLFGWVLVSALADQGVTELVIPAGQLAALVAAAGVAGVLSSARAARQAANFPILDAISGG